YDPTLTVVLIIRRPPQVTLFPYTTLFRSANSCRTSCKLAPAIRFSRASVNLASLSTKRPASSTEIPTALKRLSGPVMPATRLPRSEEHTSELQSPDQLVCRLLLEKKHQNE